MKKVILIFLTIFLYAGCAVTKQNVSIVGKFSGETPWMGSFVPRGEMNLWLKENKIFELNWHDVDYSGKWERIENNYILLKFDELTDPFLYIRSGVISDRERQLRIINKNKLQFESWTLKRISH